MRSGSPQKWIDFTSRSTKGDLPYKLKKTLKMLVNTKISSVHFRKLSKIVNEINIF